MSLRNHPANETIELTESGARLHLDGDKSGKAGWMHRSLRRRQRVEFTAMKGHVHTGSVQFPCPGCGAPGHVDIRDNLSGRHYLSCNSCFKMWQQVTQSDPNLVDPSYSMR